jgi:hypothetical protein
LQIAVPLKCEDKIALGWSGTTALQFAGGTGQAMKKPTPWVQLATTMHKDDQDEENYRLWEITKQTFADIDEMSPSELEALLENVTDQEDWSDLRERAKRRTAQWLAALTKADVAPRCSHVKLDGSACGSPAMNGSTTCYQHGDERPKRLAEQAARILEAPLLENRCSVQMAITRVCGMLATKQIDQAVGRTMIAALGLAQRNIGEKKSIYE